MNHCSWLGHFQSRQRKSSSTKTTPQNHNSDNSFVIETILLLLKAKRHNSRPVKGHFRSLKLEKGKDSNCGRNLNHALHTLIPQSLQLRVVHFMYWGWGGGGKGGGWRKLPQRPLSSHPISVILKFQTKDDFVNERGQVNCMTFDRWDCRHWLCSFCLVYFDNWCSWPSGKASDPWLSNIRTQVWNTSENLPNTIGMHKNTSGTPPEHPRNTPESPAFWTTLLNTLNHINNNNNKLSLHDDYYEQSITVLQKLLEFN